ncbi:siroheme synthase [Flavobacterium akiainvivens]|uniref:uroporphyrinogen-III C-methyltransferase n=1 Tax=Flavobacterium akiainvivens TaxID=1202724 RepID=A0A0M8M8N3_9FLAO|nr:uroporphyrinogen-III C-methyltransferase [Flavobacterium akiainvivens]KOS04825.1 siroheme synthase [Flavobacterium akiainvivens]SFQ43626.1 uroporphyrin-III C-methyltransferase / precorrin-2 dehydrogenase / sirohydrochlorin ferrochelatase/uroporphyrin-III C-methyltransferase [Flavobacterium akiainvivens]
MKIKKGKVILAGAGPGDPDLVTVKTLRYLQQADVILTDRLVSPVLIEQNARKDAHIVYVGKQCSKGIHTPQSDINALMAELALKGHLVLRLKGGDVSLFSNVLDELETLKKYHIPYEIIPGVSAAFGAAAYTGIPLTARGYSRGVRFLTLYDLGTVKHTQWQDWAETDDTLVFYMSGQKLEELTQKLIRIGIDPEKGIAIVQQATTPFQKTTIRSFYEINRKGLPGFGYVPTLIIIGSVVNLHKQYAWIKENHAAESYFDNHKNTFQYAAG